LLPLGDALEGTDGADLIARQILAIGDCLPIVATLVVVMAVTMLMSDFVSNDLATVLMAPIAISVAGGLDVSIDPFLMAVAVGASSAFLTPIGQQSNLLVMEPGGYKFSDYWKMGLPLEILVMAVAIPLILVFWGF
jgi:di/tricarboxylate transporter